MGFRPENVRLYLETASTICNGTRPGFTNGVIIKEQHLFENHSQDTRFKGPLDVSPMLPAQLGTGGNNTPFVVEKQPIYCLQGNGIDRADTAGCNGKGWTENVSYTLNTIDRPAVSQAVQIEKRTETLVAAVDCRNGTEDPDINGTLQAHPSGGTSLNLNNVARIHHIVRRLTPTECARLQGFPDDWGHPDVKAELTDEEYAFWLGVRNTHAEINGKPQKTYTREQMLKWYNSLHTDSAEYKMWGNGIALPCAVFVMQGIAEELKKQKQDSKG